MKEPSQRQLRVGQQVRQELMRMLKHGGFKHEALMDSEKITVTEVSMSPDLKNAKAFVLYLGVNAMPPEILKGLNDVAPHMQGKVSRLLGMRSTPKLWFAEDKAFLTGQHMNQVLSGLDK